MSLLISSHLLHSRGKRIAKDDLLVECRALFEVRTSSESKRLAEHVYVRRTDEIQYAACQARQARESLAGGISHTHAMAPIGRQRTGISIT